MQFAVQTDWLITLLLCSTRCIAWMSIAPPMATGGVPSHIKAIFGVALGLALVPSSEAHAPPPELVPVIGALVLQIVVGVGLGFLTRLLFSAVEAAGSALDMFGGFSMAIAYDPFTKSATSVFGKFYAILCTTLIFATNTHLVIFGGFIRSFDAIPLDGTFNTASLAHAVTTGMTQMFVATLQIAGPLIVVLFIADVALGIMNRIAPQLNAFQLSFPIKIGLTMLLTGIGFATMPRTVIETANHVNNLISSVIGGG
ncbi:MAG TPA: flagellar biosynthetic protein FliR [Jatrophihabitans sp.]